MFGFFKKKPDSPPEPQPPKQEQSDIKDPFVRKAVEAGEHATNEIEGLYGMFRMGIMDPPTFFRAIINKGFLIACTDRNDVNTALFLQHPDGASRLVVFSAAERAQKVVQQHPSYRHVFEVPLSQLLLGLPANSGFVMNPLHEAMTFQATPEQAQRIRADFVQHT